LPKGRDRVRTAPVRRIYSETLGFDELVTPRISGLLRRYRLHLVVAVRPWQVSDLPRVVGEFERHGVPVAVWPMLEDIHGRWVNVHNATKFAEFVRQVVDALAMHGRTPTELVLDLEPSFAHARALAQAASAVELDWSQAWGLAQRATSYVRTRVRTRTWPGERDRARRTGFEAATVELNVLINEMHARGMSTAAVALPVVALDSIVRPTWQVALGTPVRPLCARRVNFMMYTSLVEGWSRGLLSRRDALTMLEGACVRAVEAWGPDVGLSLGCVGTGALRDEPTYRDPRELACDVAVAQARGITDLTLFDLSGVVARGPAEAWLDAFVTTPPALSDAELARGRWFYAARTLVRAATWAVQRRDEG